MFLFVLTLFTGEWIETTQQDFRDGFYEANLYPSHRGDGAVEFSGRLDLNNDGYIDIPGSGWIMWGSSSGYSSSNMTNYVGGGGCDAADLNTDGYPDFITTLMGSSDMGGSEQIFWGNKQGPDPINEFQMSVEAYNNEGIMAADFNKDGYLDLLASIDDDNAAVFWGSATGYSSSNSASLPCWKTGYNPEVADLNKDGWLDVIVISGEDPNNYIYWGSPGGLDANQFTRVIVPFDIGGHGISVADLNYDGWLDIVYAQNCAGFHDAIILWGDGAIYHPGTEINANFRLPLPDRAFGGSSIADLNEDGYLDIVFFGNDGVPPRIFWGAANGISANRYQDLNLSFGVGTGGLVADFTRDGHLDIVELSYDGTVLFHGPGFTSHDDFSPGTHHGFAREIGNVYTRKYTEEYHSSIYDAGHEVLWTMIHWDDSCPGTSSIKLAVRTGSNPDTSQDWSSWITVQNGTDIPGRLQTRYIQYRATFEYPNPAYLPVLFLVGIEFTMEDIIVQPDRHLQGVTLDTITTELDVLNYTHNPDVVEVSWTGGRPDWFHEVRDSLGNPLRDADSDGSPDVGLLPPEGGMNKLRVRIGIPDSTPAGTADTFIVYGRSSVADTLYDSALVITTVRSEGILIIDPDREGSVSPDEATIRYPLVVINEFNRNEIGEITWNSALGWPIALYDSTGRKELKDSNGNGTPDVGELEALGGNCSLYVEIRMPEEFDPTRGVLDSLRGPVTAVETTIVYVYAASDGVKNDSAILVTSALPGLTLHNFPNPFDGETRIVWSQPERGDVTIRVADRAGRPVGTVLTERCDAGVHSHIWEANTDSGQPLAPGVYILLLDFEPMDSPARRILAKAVCTGREQQ